MSAHSEISHNGPAHAAETIEANPSLGLFSASAPASLSSSSPQSSSAHCFGSRNPLAPFVLSRGLLKLSLPLVIAILSLTAYSTMDRLLPADVTYGSLEYAGSESAMQSYIDRLDRAQFAVVGFSAGLHLLNALMYAAVLALAGSISSLQLRAAGHATLGSLADASVYAQPLPVLLYLIQHVTLLSMFVRRDAGRGQPQLVAACSVLFLALVGCCVMSNGAVAMWIVLVFKRKHGGKSPLALRMEAEEREARETTARAEAACGSQASSRFHLSNSALVAPPDVVASPSSVQMNQLEVNAARSSATMDAAV